ncbi:MAG: undecaprenyl-diphosphate phosphatase [Gemmatimonadales bacterium]|nr:MAG: undecaprenyl-diphosphate phosphatase [Gemmatimonadales bacterium]
MTLWEAILLGVVQGVFMFVPVSSTSHLVLVQHWLLSRGSQIPAPESPEMILFDLVVHVGTLVSMAVVFRKSIVGLGGRVSRELRGRHPGDPLGLRLVALGLGAVVVTGLVGFPLRSIFSEVFARPAAISVTLVITGILLWWTDVLPPRKRGLREMTPLVAAGIGLAQGLALLPGLSRSGSTIAAALFLGVRRRWAAEFSFFIAFPTILGATAIMGLEVLGAGEIRGISPAAYLIGAATAAVVGIGALKLVLKLLYRARFRYFSWYVWFLAAGILLFSLGGN